MDNPQETLNIYFFIYRGSSETARYTPFICKLYASEGEDTVQL